jgi:hypothetical protein
LQAFLAAVSLKSRNVYCLLPKDFSSATMADQALQSTRPIIWNDIISSSCFSPGQPIHIPLDTHGSDTFTNPSMSGSPSESPTIDSIFPTPTAGCEDICVLHNVPGTTDKIPLRMKTACRKCRRRKVRCEQNEKVRYREG